jgi:transglycosylase-like protein with SLT domain
MVTVPSQYQQYINQAATGTGLPANVVAAQANEESEFNPNAVSSAGAEGFWQFEPTTYNDVAASAGVPVNTEFNVGYETQAYITYMNQLLSEEGGNVYQALEAYNAGPGNLSAGAGYASTILAQAGEPANLSAGNATLTSFNPLSGITSLFGIPLPGSSGSGGINLGGITNSVFGAIEDSILKSLGLPNLKDLLQRLGIILLGAALILVGISMLAKGPVVNIVNTTKKATPEAAEAAAVVLCRIRLRLTGMVPIRLLTN